MKFSKNCTIAANRPDWPGIVILEHGGIPPLSGLRRTRAMKPKSRFVKSIIANAATEQVEMPWKRGARRAAFIAKRNAAAKVQKSA